MTRPETLPTRDNVANQIHCLIALWRQIERGMEHRRLDLVQRALDVSHTALAIMDDREECNGQEGA